MEVKILERRRLWKMSRTKRRKIVFYIRLCTVKYRKIKASNVQRTHVFAPVNTSTTDLFYFCHSCFSCITCRAVILRFYVSIFFFFSSSCISNSRRSSVFQNCARKRKTRGNFRVIR